MNLWASSEDAHSLGNQVFQHVEMAVHVFRRHICFATLSATLRRAGHMIAPSDEKVNGEDLELFIQDIEVYAGERQGLS